MQFESIVWICVHEIGRATFRVAQTGSDIWRGGRVAEGARLESVFRLTPNEGSNPSLCSLQGAHRPLVEGQWLLKRSN